MNSEKSIDLLPLKSVSFRLSIRPDDVGLELLYSYLLQIPTDKECATVVRMLLMEVPMSNTELITKIRSTVSIKAPINKVINFKLMICRRDIGFSGILRILQTMNDIDRRLHVKRCLIDLISSTATPVKTVKSTTSIASNAIIEPRNLEPTSNLLNESQTFIPQTNTDKKSDRIIENESSSQVSSNVNQRIRNMTRNIQF